MQYDFICDMVWFDDIFKVFNLMGVVILLDGVIYFCGQVLSDEMIMYFLLCCRELVVMGEFYILNILEIVFELYDGLLDMLGILYFNLEL